MQNIKWTKEICQTEALKYLSKKEFVINNRNAHDAAWKNGWLDEICSHMEIQGNLYKRLIYAYEFPDKFVYVGLTYNIEERQQNRNGDKNDPVTKHQKETGLIPIRKILTDFLEVEEASKQEKEYVEKYKTESWNILNRRTAGALGNSHTTILSKSECLESAKKYATRTKWAYSDTPAYNRAKKYGKEFFEECCQHMIQIRHKIYTYNELKLIADKYFILSDFKLKENKVYQAIVKSNHYNELTKHMKRLK